MTPRRFERGTRAMRRIIGLILIILLVLAAIADRVSVVELILRLPSWLQFALGWLTPPETWLIDNRIHPLPLILAAVVFFALVVTPSDLRAWLPKQLRPRPREDFAASFAAREQREARHEFRWGIERCYRRYAEHDKIACNNDSLVRLIDGLRFPTDFPGPAGRSLAHYAASVAWPSPEGEHLWDFARHVFANALQSERDEFLGTDSRSFLRAQRATAQFWDECGRAIGEGRLRSNAMRREIASNARDIKLLALIELALAELIPWGGTGKSGLFWLAKDLRLMRPEHGETQKDSV
jgi:hypothetical protein